MSDPSSVLAPYVEAEIFGPAEEHLVRTLDRLAPGVVTPEVALGAALAIRAPRHGHVCVDLASVRSELMAQAADGGRGTRALPWPELASWIAALEASPLVHSGAPMPSERPLPLVWDQGQLYLQRYWRYERAVADALADRAVPRVSWDSAAVDDLLDRLFPHDPGTEHDGTDLQRHAARRAVLSGVSVMAGGPGTGKTYTVARALVLACQVAEQRKAPVRIGLAAPTGKAASRMGDAIRGAVGELRASGTITDVLADTLLAVEPSTIHRLLGWRPGVHFAHDASTPLELDLVIIDETSMVALPLMARLMDALPDHASLVLVGDPDQLSSIEAGTVMDDIVGPTDRDGESPSASGPLSGQVTVLRRARRFRADSGIALLADAIRSGESTTVIELLASGRSDVAWVAPSDASGRSGVVAEVTAAGIEVVERARAGDGPGALAAASRTKVLTALRRGRGGLADWTEQVRTGVRAEVGGQAGGSPWYVGRPVLVTGNDRANGVFNGDVGVVVETEEGLLVAFEHGAQAVRFVTPARLARVEDWWAMTIHKSQGSEFDHVVVSLPTQPSPILTRQLLYTAVTRAKERITVVADEAVLRSAIETSARRASGLRGRLWT